MTSPAGKEQSRPELSAEDVDAQVLDIVRALVAELHPSLVDARRVRLDSNLDRDLASRPREFHRRALPEPCVNLSIHTAPDVRPLP